MDHPKRQSLPPYTQQKPDFPRFSEKKIRKKTGTGPEHPFSIFGACPRLSSASERGLSPFNFFPRFLENGRGTLASDGLPDGKVPRALGSDRG